MSDPKMANRLELRWFPVVDPRGHARMQAQWVTPAEEAKPRVTHAA